MPDITTKTVNGKKMETFTHHNGSSAHKTAREILAYDDDVKRVSVGGISTTDAFDTGINVWFDKGAESINWEAPPGWHISKASTFESGAMCITIEPEA